MKILIINPWIIYRGAETVIILQAKGLKKLGATPVILSLSVDWSKVTYEAKELEYLLPPRIIGDLLRSSRILMLLFAFPILLIMSLRYAKEFDILMPHNLPSHWIAAVIGKLYSKPVIWNCHAVPKPSPSFGFWQAVFTITYTSPLERWAGREMNAIIVDAEKVKKEVKEKYGVTSIVLNPPIPDLKRGKRREMRKKYNLEKSFVFLHIAVLHPEKNQIVSLRAFAKAKEEIPNAVLVIAGEGPESEVLGKVAKELHISENVRFTGFIHPDKLANIFAAADVHLAPYHSTEGGPLTVFEALRQGVISIVAHNAGASSEIGKKYGFTYNTFSTVESFSKAMVEIYENRLKYSDKARLGKIWIYKNLDLETYTKKIISVCNTVYNTYYNK